MKKGYITLGFIFEVMMFMTSGSYFTLAQMFKADKYLLAGIISLGIALFTALTVGEWIEQFAIKKYQEQNINIKKSIKRTLKRG